MWHLLDSLASLRKSPVAALFRTSWARGLRDRARSAARWIEFRSSLQIHARINVDLSRFRDEHYFRARAAKHPNRTQRRSDCR